MPLLRCSRERSITSLETHLGSTGRSLPSDYRETTISLWDKYRLRNVQHQGARLGNVKKELSALFVYVCMDNYVSSGGSLGFVIPGRFQDRSE